MMTEEAGISPITDDVAQDARKAVLCWLATLGPNGQPSVSPKEMWEINAHKQLLIADIASAVSVRNIRANPDVCVSFLDIFTQKGHQLYGKAKIIERGAPDFAGLGRRMIEKAEPKFRIRNLIVVQVTRQKPIIAPSYGFSPKPSEQEMAEQSYETYGVRPIG